MSHLALDHRPTPPPDKISSNKTHSPIIFRGLRAKVHLHLLQQQVTEPMNKSQTTVHKLLTKLLLNYRKDQKTPLLPGIKGAVQHRAESVLFQTYLRESRKLKNHHFKHNSVVCTWHDLITPMELCELARRMPHPSAFTFNVLDDTFTNFSNSIRVIYML